MFRMCYWRMHVGINQIYSNQVSSARYASGFMANCHRSARITILDETSWRRKQLRLETHLVVLIRRRWDLQLFVATYKHTKHSITIRINSLREPHELTIENEIVQMLKA